MSQSPKLKILIDQDMPAIDELFSDIAVITKRKGRDICHNDLVDADALLCRSVTQVNQSLLQNSAVKFVGTATIGTDHFDLRWLQQQQIRWANAAGCNADAVAQYVLSAIAYWIKSGWNNPTQTHQTVSMRELKVGIIGAGHVGTALSACLGRLNIDYWLCDPPLQEQGDPRAFVSLEQALQADVVSLHVPITRQVSHSTHHLMDQSRLTGLAQGLKQRQQSNGSKLDRQLVINASRGAVIDNVALSDFVSGQGNVDWVLDVFENEPDIAPQLVEKCLLATPHIAGHSLEGKLRGSYMIYKAFCRHFGLKAKIREEQLHPEKQKIAFINGDLESRLLAIFPIQMVSDAMKLAPSGDLSSKFDQLRKNATKLANGTTRRDYSGYEFSQWSDFPL